MTPLSVSRRRLLQAGAGGAVAAALASGGMLSAAQAKVIRHPGTLPDPHRPEGTPDETMPFEHIVIVMMENRSFDHYFGMLPLKGQRLADGFRFDKHGRPLDRNPLDGKHVPVFSVDGTPCSALHSGSQSWHDSHVQINGGHMNGFAKTGPGSMAYFTDETIPFYYSLASTFTLANRWFCSVPAQTYPNRRFLMAGTAYGNISTENSSIFANGKFAAAPPNGTIFDVLSENKISWKNYFTDLPQTAIIPTSVFKHPTNIVPVAEFFTDCAAGTLPSVSYVDPEFGGVAVVGDEVRTLKIPTFVEVGTDLDYQNGDEENPADVQLGENFMARVVNAVMSSPLWHKTLLVWTYDEHGGFYDHVPPPKALKPDSIPPLLKKGDPAGGYDIYGPRVPAVVVSPWSKPRSVTNVVHDHTSTLATIQAKWNLPALTYRDANAATMMDFLDVKRAAFMNPPKLAAPSNPLPGEVVCLTKGQATPPKPS